MFPIRPNEDRVIVKPETLADKVGSLFIPDIAKGEPKKGTVMRVGPGLACKHCGVPKAIDLVEGAVVVFPEGAGHDFELDGEKYKVIRASDIQLIEDPNVQSTN